MKMVLLIGVRYSVSISGAARRCSAFRLDVSAALFFLKELTASRTSFFGDFYRGRSQG